MPVFVFLVAQGTLLLLVLVERGWDLVRALVQNLQLGVLLTVLALFWAVRLKTSGAVLVASLLSVVLLSPWVFFSPVVAAFGSEVPRLLGIPMPYVKWMWNVAVLTIAIVILWQYARRRLRRPEVMLA